MSNNTRKISATAQMEQNVCLGNNVEISEGVIIRAGCIIGENVTIGRNVYLDYGVIIRDNVAIGDNSFIGAQCILGEYLADFYESGKGSYHPLNIGRDSLIRSGTVIYGDNTLGEYLQTGHRVTIREQSRIGHHVRIGTLCDIQGYCEIQDYVHLHSNVHVGQKSLIQKYAWLFPYVVLTNDPNPPSNILKGVTVGEFAVISTGSILLPGVIIGKDALVGAGAIVTKDVSANMVAIGNPARMKCGTEQILDDTTKKQVYPWRYTFDRGMPWQGMSYEDWSREYEDPAAF